MPTRAAIVVTVSLALLQFGALAAHTPVVQDDRLLVVNGVLTRTGKAGTLWNVTVDDRVSFRGGAIREVSFLTEPGDRDSLFYAQFDGARVELAGEVKSVFEGVASLARVDRIGLHEGLTAALLSGSASPAPMVGATAHERYRHAYYLFQDGGSGCERCYVPLVICHDALEVTATGGDAAFCSVIVTYERDSIWRMRGAARIEPPAVDPHARTLRMEDRSYRYQEIRPSEVLHLLENPYGSIPISRPFLINTIAPGGTISDLIADFRDESGVQAARGGRVARIGANTVKMEPSP